MWDKFKHNLSWRIFSWKNLLLPLLSILLLVWVARTISLEATLATLRQLGTGELILLIVINLAVLATFSARWWLLLRTLGYRIPVWRLMGYRLTAFAISYFTPGSHFGGEPYQVFAVSHYHRVPVSISLAAITLDKILEMLINLAVLLAGALILLTMHSNLAGWIEWQIIAYSFILLAIPVALLVALWQGRHPLTGVIAFVGKLIRRPLLERGWAQTVRQSEEQAGWLCQTRPRMVGLAFLITLCTWVGVIWEYWLLTDMLGLDLTMQQLVASLVAARVAILLPVPAGLGALEAGQMLAMESVGLDPNVGVAIAVVIRARDVLSALVGLALGGAHIWQRVDLPAVELPTAEWKPAKSERKVAPTKDAHHSISPP
jgi:glycosyltransferase 2 family protein